MIKKYGAIFGLILGIFSIFGSFIIEGGSFQALFLIAPIFIVMGGTFAATIISVGLDNFSKIFVLIKLAYFPRKYNLKKLITDLFMISIKVRKDGILSVEKDIDNITYHFPRKLLRFAIDGVDSETIENIALLEMKSTEIRHNNFSNMFNKMGGYSPTMGILGTVMALIITLANAGSDPELLIKNIASAFIATLWGVLSANLFWLPISDRLKKCHQEEKNMMELSLEGTLALQNGEIPSVLKARMISMLPPKDQDALLGS